MSDQFLLSDGSDLTSDRRPVLVPVDFSSCSKAALLFATHLGRCVQAPLLVLHVVHDLNHEPGFYSKNGVIDSMRPIADVAADMLVEFIDDVRKCDSTGELSSATLQTLLVNGLPSQRIAEIAVRENAALIVMGTHGRSGLSRLASGSVAADVMKHSEVPVTIVKAPRSGSDNHAMAIGSSQWWSRQASLKGRDPHQTLSV